MIRLTIVLLALCSVQILAKTRTENIASLIEDGLLDDIFFYNHGHRSKTKKAFNPEEETSEFWNNKAQSTLAERLAQTQNTNIAKNIILFVGDGMSIPTLAAARTYLGQQNGKPGEETELSFEKFPVSGLSKTYCVDSQVADSACSATAYLCGVKAKSGTIGITASVPKNDCKATLDESTHVHSLAYWAQLKGKRTGLVTTTRVTHASPSGVYAHIGDRNWEADTLMLFDRQDPNECPDIAVQMVHSETGKNLNVALGGGRGMFLPLLKQDGDGNRGFRLDGRNLIDEWKRSKEGTNYTYVSSRAGLLGVGAETDNLLGLFHTSHNPFNLDRDPEKTPTLAEMTERAIKTLSKGDSGFFLFVEGGRIDHGHHFTWAKKALDETVEFHKAVQVAVDLTNAEDTLIVVTSDHAHTMSFNGYAERGNDVLGVAGNGLDGLPYTTLSYANGLGYRQEKDGHRHDVSHDDLHGNSYFFPALAPLITETHGGDDVGIFARGPWAHLLSGVLEQNTIPHVMAFASCIGEGATVCDQKRKAK